MEKELETAKKIIIEVTKKFGLEVKSIFLFGSRARGDYKEDSDWDFYVIVDKKLEFQKKIEIKSKIRRRLAELKIPNDIIIQSKDVVEERKNDVGYLTYYVLKQGIEI